MMRERSACPPRQSHCIRRDSDPCSSLADGPGSSLQRLSALHSELAAAYGDLLVEVEAGLAVLAKASVHASVPAADELLTPAETAKRLHVHQRTLRRMELAGEIPPAIGKGKLKRWRRADLDRREGRRT